MRIAITHPYSWPEVRRGAERITVETARALAARGHDVTLFSAGLTASRRRQDGFTTVRFRRWFADSHRHQQWFGALMHGVLAANRFDAVHSLMPYDAAAAIRTRRLRGHRAVYEELGIPSARYWVGHPERRVREFVCRHADVYTCMSRFALAVYEDEWGSSGALIPGGVRLAQFAPPTDRAPEPTLLFSGALDEPRKGVDRLVQALPIVAEREPAVRLWLSGPGDPARWLESASPAVRDRIDVLALGDPGDQALRYGQAWCTVLPSTFESFGMVLLESLACGTPIVVADHSAPPELVAAGTGVVCRVNEEAGVPKADVSSLAEAIVAALGLARDPAIVERCRASAAGYDWDAVLAPYLERLYSMGLDAIRDGDPWPASYRRSVR